MEYTLTTAVQEHLAKTGETPESFLDRAVDALIRKEMTQGFNDLPREAVIDAVPLGLGSLLLLTFADGDRRLFDGDILNDCVGFKNICTEFDFDCACVEGYTVAWKDNHGLHDGLFDELPPGFLYENSVSLIDLKDVILPKLRLKKSEVSQITELPTADVNLRESADRGITKTLITGDNLREKVFLPDDFVRASDPDMAKATNSAKKKRRTKKKPAPPVSEDFISIGEI